MAPAPLLYLLPQQPLLLKTPAPGIMWEPKPLQCIEVLIRIFSRWKAWCQMFQNCDENIGIIVSRSTVDLTNEYSALPNLTGRAIPRDIPFINRLFSINFHYILISTHSHYVLINHQCHHDQSIVSKEWKQRAMVLATLTSATSLDRC